MMHTHGFMRTHGFILKELLTTFKTNFDAQNKITYEEIKNTYLIDEIQFYWLIEQTMGVIC